MIFVHEFFLTFCKHQSTAMIFAWLWLHSVLWYSKYTNHHVWIAFSTLFASSVSDLCTYVRKWCTKCNFDTENFAQHITVMHTFLSVPAMFKKEVLFQFFMRTNTDWSDKFKKKEVWSFRLAETTSFLCAHTDCHFFHKMLLLHWLLPIKMHYMVKNTDSEKAIIESSL